ncbi:MAG: helix-turn-helix domain-containing protein, partial [Myxococcales bacterium]
VRSRAVPELRGLPGHRRVGALRARGGPAPARVARRLAPARHAGLSQWHFQRIFRALTGETLKTYVRSRRFAHALDRLAHSDERVLEIALAAGFDSQEAFTRAFKKAFGVTPARYRRSHRETPFLRKVRFDEDYLVHLHGGVSLEPAVSVMPGRVLVGLSTRFFGSDSEKNNVGTKLPALWGEFMPRLPGIAGQVLDAGETRPTGYGVIRQTSERSDELEYLAAIAVAPDAPVPAGMVRLELPATRRAIFRHRGHLQQLDRTVNYIYSSWLARSGLRHPGGPDLEVYGPGYRHEQDDSEVLYAIPVEG